MKYSDRRGALYLGFIMLADGRVNGAVILEATATMIPEKAFCPGCLHWNPRVYPIGSALRRGPQ